MDLKELFTNLANPDSILSLSDTDAQVAIAAYDKVAGKIETYKALADKISNSGEGGLVAYMAVNTTNPKADVLDPKWHNMKSLQKYLICFKVLSKLEALIPGKEFKITSVSEIYRWNKNNSKRFISINSISC